MALNVPEPVAAYLAAEEAKDADALSRCFIEDGTVHDEGRDYRGRKSIRQWKPLTGTDTVPLSKEWFRSSWVFILTGSSGQSLP